MRLPRRVRQSRDALAAAAGSAGSAGPPGEGGRAGVGAPEEIRAVQVEWVGAELGPAGSYRVHAHVGLAVVGAGVARLAADAPVHAVTTRAPDVLYVSRESTICR